MKKSKLFFLLYLIPINCWSAASPDVELYLSSVSSIFINNNFAGDWISGCTISSDGSYAEDFHYTFLTDGNLTTISNVYIDTSCNDLKETKKEKGILFLTGHTINQFGVSYFKFSLINATNEQTILINKDEEYLSVVIGQMTHSFTKQQ